VCASALLMEKKNGIFDAGGSVLEMSDTFVDRGGVSSIADSFVDFLP